jgi:hypothetical protein
MIKATLYAVFLRSSFAKSLSLNAKMITAIKSDIAVPEIFAISDTIWKAISGFI